MARLEEGIDAFVQAVREHEAGSFRAADPDEISAVEAELGPFTETLRAWYLRAAPVEVWVPWTAEDMAFFDLDDLRGAQSGYRWHGNDESVVLAGWNPAWLVIANFSGDPVIASLDSDETPVSFARHGAGSWSPREVAPGLPAFLAAMAVWMNVCLGEYGGEIRDEVEFELKPEFKERLAQALSGVLGPEHREAFLSFVD